MGMYIYLVCWYNEVRRISRILKKADNFPSLWNKKRRG